MDNDLGVIQDRLRWAQIKSKQFKGLVKAYLNNSHCFIEEYRHQHGESVLVEYKLRSDIAPPNEMRFLAGDIIHNIRSAIDNTVWLIGQKHGARERIAFTICGDEGEYAKYEKRMRFELLPPELREWVRMQQPFCQDSTRTPLDVIHDVWIDDKHKTPALLVHSQVGYGMQSGIHGSIMCAPSGLGDKNTIAIAELIMPHDKDFKLLVTFDIFFDLHKRSVAKLFDKILVQLEEELLPIAAHHLK